MYQPYKGAIYNIREAHRQKNIKLKPHDIEEKAYRIFKDIGYANLDHVPQDNFQIALELAHYQCSHKVICITNEMAEVLSRTNFQINLDNLHIPYHLFEICFQDGLEICGYKIPSALCLVNPDNPTFEALRKKLKQGGDIMVEEINELRKVDGYPPINCENIYTINPSMQDCIRITFADCDNASCHISIPTKNEVFKDKSIDWIINNMGTLKGSEIGLNNEEQEISRILTKIVFGAIAYYSVKDSDIERYKFHGRPALGKSSPECVIIGGKMSHDKGYHLRRGHYRVLAHERFKRDNSGNVRVVWVSGSEVNKDNDPANSKRKVVEED